MAKHDVRFYVPERDLGNADIKFSVDRDGERLGALFVSKGALVWWSKNGKQGFKLTWSQLETLAREHGTPKVGT